MLKVAVVGAPGYSGEELLRVLVGHPEVKITHVSGKEDREEKIQDIFPYLRGALDLPCEALDKERVARDADLIFLALPHTVSMELVPFFLFKGKRVVDVGADYRLKDLQVFKKYYGKDHADPQNVPVAVYGLPELNRSAIKGAKLVANPGCYPTGAALGLLPIVKNGLRWKGNAIIDSKSGVTGAGRKAVKTLLFSEVNENFKAYKVFTHQHVPEIAQTLGTGKFIFTPHLVPLDRGILSTIYVELENKKDAEGLQKTFESHYAKEPFVKVLPTGKLPEVKYVRMTNQCHIGIVTRTEDASVIIVTAIDNLGKGAATQAVQNMNLMYGFRETAGLR